MIKASPKNSDALDDTEHHHRARPAGRSACARAPSRSSVPPSPLLSARSSTITYLKVTMKISAHRISDSTPNTASGSPLRCRPRHLPPRGTRKAGLCRCRHRRPRCCRRKPEPAADEWLARARLGHPRFRRRCLSRRCSGRSGNNSRHVSPTDVAPHKMAAAYSTTFGSAGPSVSSARR